jgi:hypothetical protein
LTCRAGIAVALVQAEIEEKAAAAAAAGEEEEATS